MRYILFGGSHYYPIGGALDFLCAYDDLEDAKDGARYHLGKSAARANRDDVMGARRGNEAGSDLLNCLAR
jgi:hypothetical protein